MKRSKKRLVQEEEYKQVRKDYLEEHPYCEVCGMSSNQIHHRIGRDGDLINEKKYFLATCGIYENNCHSLIHQNPEWSYKKGYMLKRNEK